MIEVPTSVDEHIGPDGLEPGDCIGRVEKKKVDLVDPRAGEFGQELELMLGEGLLVGEHAEIKVARRAAAPLRGRSEEVDGAHLGKLPEDVL